MKLNELALNGIERIELALRSLYAGYGYTQYKQRKFEEYDLYSKNKQFLVSDRVITFTDTDGKLMALKPDVTLSIIKNSKDMPETVQKLSYNESVYRVSKGTGTFREVKQTGLECFGDIDAFQAGEVLLLAAKSLQAVSERFVLDISNLSILNAFLDRFTQQTEIRREVLKCVGEKNAHGIVEICERYQIPAEQSEPLLKLLRLSGTIETVMPRLEEVAGGIVSNDELSRFKAILGVFENSGMEDRVRLDFSVSADVEYYNDIIFKGFIEKVPESVLSGGQYDNLMRKLHRNARAIGFAIYLDLLERLDETAQKTDVDMVLLYDDSADPGELHRAISSFTEKGRTVFTCKKLNPKLTYAQLAEYRNGEVTIVETNG